MSRIWIHTFYSYTSRRLTTLLLFTIAAGSAMAQCVTDSVKADCGNTTVFFERQWYDTTSPFALVHVHENETTALQAAQWLLDSVQQGSLTTWRGQRQRFVDFSLGSKNFRFDPNRIYTPEGIENTVGPEASDTVIAAVESVADTFLQHFVSPKMMIVALHNNTEGGGLSVKSYYRGGIYAKDALAVFINARQDADDFFYTTENRFFLYLKDKGYNVVLQNNERVTDDGSLSVFCSRHSISYINIEAEEGHLLQQKKMLMALWPFIQEQINLIKPNPGLKDN